MIKNTFLRNYGLSLALLGAIVIGSVVGLSLQLPALQMKGEDFVVPATVQESFNYRMLVGVFKPCGDLFLNALFTIVVPLVFFSISSAVAGMTSGRRLAKVLMWMLIVFVATGLISSLLMVGGVQAFPPAQGLHPAPIAATQATSAAPMPVGKQIVEALTVGDFWQLLSKKNMLSLIVFAALVGLATAGIGEKGKPFAAFLISGNDVTMKVISYIMCYAPIGLLGYFAYLVGFYGMTLLADYGRAMVLYYPLCIGYFFVAFTIYALLAGGGAGVRKFWSNIAPASLTALGTGSSFATIPSNLLAADRIGVPRDVSEVVIPIGATIHMDGSCMSAILKIAFLYGFYGRAFEGFDTIATAIGIAILSGTVMSGIPGGGFTGEILIVTLGNFRPEALPLIQAIGTLVDPPATMVNAIGDNVASMLVTRITGGRGWMNKKVVA